MKKVKPKSFTPSPPPASSEVVCNHQCSTCVGYRKLASAANVDAAAAAAPSSPTKATAPTTSHANDKKLFKIQIKKPLLKSFVLSANKGVRASAIGSGVAFAKIKQEIGDANHYSDELQSAALSQSLSSITSDSITVTNFMQTAAPTQPQYNTETMQFSNPKKTHKQINSFNFNKSNDFLRQQKNRSYSPPLPATHRLASMVSSESHHTAPTNNNKYKNSNNNNGRRRSNSSRDRDRNRSSEKRRKHRRTHSRGSRSRSR